VRLPRQRSRRPQGRCRGRRRHGSGTDGCAGPLPASTLATPPTVNTSSSPHRIRTSSVRRAPVRARAAAPSGQANAAPAARHRPKAPRPAKGPAPWWPGTRRAPRRPPAARRLPPWEDRTSTRMPVAETILAGGAVRFIGALPSVGSRCKSSRSSRRGTTGTSG
jgi:hypothetical protein